MVPYGRLWAWLIGVMVASVAVLGYYGWEIYQDLPPGPLKPGAGPAPRA